MFPKLIPLSKHDRLLGKNTAGLGRILPFYAT